MEQVSSDSSDISSVVTVSSDSSDSSDIFFLSFNFWQNFKPKLWQKIKNKNWDKTQTAIVTKFKKTQIGTKL